MKLFALTLLALLLPSPVFPESGNELTVLRISKDKRALEVQRLGDSLVKRVEVLAKCDDPAVGKPQGSWFKSGDARISWFEQSGDSIIVGYGHCVAKVFIRNLTTECSGCD